MAERSERMTIMGDQIGGDLREDVFQTFLPKLLGAVLTDPKDIADSGTFLNAYSQDPSWFDVTIMRPAPDITVVSPDELTFFVLMRDTERDIDATRQLEVGMRVNERRQISSNEVDEDIAARSLRGRSAETVALGSRILSQESAIIVFVADVWNEGEGIMTENLGGVRMVKHVDGTVSVSKVTYLRGSTRYQQTPLDLNDLGMNASEVKTGYNNLMTVLKEAEKQLPSRK